MGVSKNFTIGLTGGISSGKTIVSDILSSVGAYIIDADIISREVVEKGSVGSRQIEECFPTCVCDGVVDRQELRKLVFGNKFNLEKLNAIVHPLVTNEVKKRLFFSKSFINVLVAPLLIETGLNSMVDEVWLVIANREKRINRLMERDNIDRALAEKMLASQSSDEEKLGYADRVIINDCEKDILENRIRSMYNNLLVEIS